jgi:dTDP-4-amino-4,6-dideoxygalactose transaminase
VFNTFEGGAIISPTRELKLYIDKLKNFGHDGETSVVEAGINGKMSEINCAFGLLQLKHIDAAIARRGEIDAAYRKGLNGIRGITCLGDSGEEVPNYAYFPILVSPTFPETRDDLYNRMKSHGVHSRRYFYPLITEFPMYRDFPSSDRNHLPVATRAADQILCLPIYPDLDDAAVARIIDLIAAA